MLAFSRNFVDNIVNYIAEEKRENQLKVGI